MPTDIIATEGLTEVRKFEEVEVEEPWCPTFRISQFKLLFSDRTDSSVDISASPVNKKELFKKVILIMGE